MSIRRLLLLYVLAHDADGRSSAGGSEVAGRPEHAFPVALADVRALPAQQATGNTLETVHERGDSHFGRVFHEQVDVVVFAVHLHQRGVRVRADVGEDAAQEVDSLCVEHTAAIFCYEDQMHVQLENAVSAMPDVAFIAHRTTVS